jgi:hypothetical protein
MASAERRLAKNPESKTALKDLERAQFAYRRQETLLKIIDSHLAGDHYVNDASGWRLHTPIVQLKKELRDYLRFDGQPFVEIDIKASQPYLLTMFFQERFYRGGNAESELLLRNIHKSLYEYIQTILNKYLPIMSHKYSETPAGTQSSFDEYIGIVGDEDMDIYKEVMKGLRQVSTTRRRKPKTRKAVKQDVMTYFYSVPRMPGMYKSSTYRYFEVNFPEISAFLQDVKSFRVGRSAVEQLTYVEPDGTITKRWTEVDEGYAVLSHVLQRLEARLVLDIVCREIRQQWPEIPLLTVHDCILTTLPFVDHVKDYFAYRLNELVGVRPKLDVKSITAQAAVSA